jgi:hypothetical protein
MLETKGFAVPGSEVQSYGPALRIRNPIKSIGCNPI